ncbi:MAG: hypothetical protein ABSE49_09265 [Polyangiaceae bacterium]
MSLRHTAAFPLACVAAGCAAAPSPPPDATHRPVAAITGIINCGYPEAVARLGLTWTTHYLAGDPAGSMTLPRARVEIANRSAVPHILHFERGVECSIDRKCSLLPWNGIDRTLGPGERFAFDVDARMSYVDRVEAEVIVVSVEGDVDGQRACVDVGAWLARAGPA